eukprot:CAMPEP_0117660194 /NCGR_PEP_ID=MMETSP0804-20121206/6838_1 /TAXON_ID=1074897 /ORGANISM="Tetraselmis astigmatica, Strain CCMP880" /LENGTH=270 /DNA_ID=CAMNT_0005466907 /DNA_START=170 /DNA_END=978 /DNA_ORIENTATION=+
MEAIAIATTDPAVFAADDITPLIEDAGKEQPWPLGLRVTRSFERTSEAGPSQGLVIRWNLTNVSGGPVQVGGLGFTLPADSNTNGLQLEEIAHTNSFVDPHMGGQHSFAEWVRVAGNRSLLVVPHTPNAKMEAWRPVLEDCLFDGSMSEWTVLSGAWAEEWEHNQQAPVWSMEQRLADTGVWPEPKSPWPSWHSNETFRLKNIQHWNPPTTLDLQPGEEASFALCVVLAEGGPRTRDDDLHSSGVASLHAIPGYVISPDMHDAKVLVLPP